MTGSGCWEMITCHMLQCHTDYAAKYMSNIRLYRGLVGNYSCYLKEYLIPRVIRNVKCPFMVNSACLMLYVQVVLLNMGKWSLQL